MASSSTTQPDARTNPYKVSIQVSATPNGDEDTEVYYKRDGTRFDSEFTLKFLVETGYEFIIFVRPSLPLKSIAVQGSSVSFTDLSSGQENQIGCSKYSFTWSSTKIDPNKKKDRTNLPLLLTFQDGVNLLIPLQVKFYRQEDTQHVTWGTPLRQIDLECDMKAGATYLDIVKTTFR